MTNHDGDPSTGRAEADAAGSCEQHGTALPCGQCAADREDYLRFLRGQVRIARLGADRTQAAQAAVTVLARHIAFEQRHDKWELGADSFADAAAETEAAAVALRRVRRITDLAVAKTAMDLADAQEDSEVARLRARCAELEKQLAESGASRG